MKTEKSASIKSKVSENNLIDKQSKGSYFFKKIPNC